MTVGQRIAARRKELKMTQEELAKKLGYKSRSSVNKIELEWAEVPLSKIEKVAAALDCDAGYLMGWSEEKPSDARRRILMALDQMDLSDQEFLADYAERTLALRRFLDTHQEHE